MKRVRELFVAQFLPLVESQIVVPQSLQFARRFSASFAKVGNEGKKGDSFL